MISTTCPEGDQLLAYVQGKLSHGQMQAIELHLAECQHCSDLADAPVEDSLCGLLRDGQSQSPIEADGTYQEAASDLKRMLKGETPTLPFDGQIGPYTLLRQIGKGGMGRVYLAIHRKLNKTVAIKLLPARADVDLLAVARFDREVRAAGALDHPAIVQATDAGEIDGVPYLVMQFIDGMDLSRLSRISSPLPEAEACEIVRQAAIAIAHAHDHRIVHRDVKPSNLMLDRSGQVKVLDLGLASISGTSELQRSLTGTGQLLGTLDYMSPEQAHDGSSDERTDIYALAATLYRLLTGRHVGQLDHDESVTPLARLHRRQSLDAVDFQSLSTPAQEVLKSALEPDPTKRIESAGQLAESLLPLCVGADLKTLAEQSAFEAETTEAESRLAGATVCDQATVTTAPNPREQSAPLPGRSHSKRSVLIGALLLGWALLAGVIVLETRQGQIVIDSDVPGVSVTFLRDGKEYDQLTLQSDTESIRLFADNYEIRLPNENTRCEISPSSVELTRGSTVVVRVRQKASTPGGKMPIDTGPGNTARFPSVPDLSDGSTGTPMTTASSGRGEPMFQGKTLSHWLNIIRFEKDPQLLAQMIDGALPYLIDSKTRGQVEKAMLTRLAEKSPKGTNLLGDSGLLLDTVESLFLNYLSKSKGILESPVLLSALQSKDAGMHYAGLRVLLVSQFVQQPGSLSPQIRQAVTPLCRSVIDEIALAAYLTIVMPIESINEEKESLASEMLAHHDDSIAYLGAHIIIKQQKDLNAVADAHRRMLEVIPRHASSHHIRRCSQLFVHGMANEEITRLACQHVLLLQRRATTSPIKLTNEAIRLTDVQDLLLDLISRGHASDEALEALHSVLDRRYALGPPAFQRLQPGQKYNPMSEGPSGEGGGSGDMGMMSMMDAEDMMGDSAASYMTSSGVSNHEAQQQPRDPFWLAILAGNDDNDIELSLKTGSPRKAIDAIYGLTGRLDAWEEPYDELPFVTAFIEVENSANGSPRWLSEGFAREYFPRTLFISFLEPFIETAALKLPKGIDGMGVAGGGVLDSDRNNVGRNASMASEGGMMMSMGMMGGSGIPSTPAYTTTRLSLPVDLATPQSPNRSRLESDLIEHHLWRLAESIQRDSDPGADLLGTWVQCWEDSLPEQEKLIVLTHDWSELLNQQRSDLSSPVLLRMLARDLSTDSANVLASAASGSNKSTPIVDPLLADALALRLSLLQKHLELDQASAIRLRPALSTVLTRMLDSKIPSQRFFAFLIANHLKLNLKTEFYVTILNTDITGKPNQQNSEAAEGGYSAGSTSPPKAATKQPNQILLPQGIRITIRHLASLVFRELLRIDQAAGVYLLGEREKEAAMLKSDPSSRDPSNLLYWYIPKKTKANRNRPSNLLR